MQLLSFPFTPPFPHLLLLLLPSLPPSAAAARFPVFLPAHSRSTQSRELTEIAVEETESRSKSLASVREELVLAVLTVFTVLFYYFI